MPPFRTRRNSVQIVKQLEQLPYRMITRARSKSVQINELQEPVRESILKKTPRSSVPKQKKSGARPRIVPTPKKSVGRPRTAPSVSRARQPKKQSKIEKCGKVKCAKLETKCKNLQVKVADLRKENLSLKNQLSVFEEWRKSELLKLGFSPSHNIWNEFENIKHSVLPCSTEINDEETSGTARPGDKKKDKENEGKCSKKRQRKNFLQEKYDKLKEKFEKQESASNLQVGTVTSIEDKISTLQKSEVDDLKVIHELEEIVSAKKGKCNELESKYQDIKRQTLLLATEYSEKKIEHNIFKANVEQCERCKKLKEDCKQITREYKLNWVRYRDTMTTLKEVHNRCAAGCRQGAMLKAELEYLKVAIDSAKQLYYGCPYVAQSGELLKTEYAMRLKREQRGIETEYRRCLAKCVVSSAPFSSSSSSSDEE